MPVTKTSAAITQLTGAGTSTVLDVSAAAGQSLYLSHSNGTGTVTAAATARVEVRPAGGGRWYFLTTVPFSLTAASVDSRQVRLEDDVAAVRVIYTPPTGPTGAALDAEVGMIAVT